VQDQDEMTWNDYSPIPGVDWADPSLVPSVGTVRIALIAADFDDQPFVITLPAGSDMFGNPAVDPVARDVVPEFYAEYWNGRSPVHHGHTLNEYWMEQSNGKVGIAVDAFGPYRMPKHIYQYGLREFGQADQTPYGAVADGDLEKDCDTLWREGAGEAIRADYHLVVRVFAGYDESGVWRKFGEMKFQTRDDIQAEWGNPDPSMPRWVPTRDGSWTSWKAASMPWSNSAIVISENSGSTMHETAHAMFGIANNYNNPYAFPLRRAGAGPWDIMDRGTFNGPGGPHDRWQVPATRGGAMPSGLMLRQRINFGFLDASSVLHLSREGLARSGPVVAAVIAREVDPRPGELAGVVVHLDGEPVPLSAPAPDGGANGGATTQDRTPWRDPAEDPLSPGIPDYSYYTVEVVQRLGFDSFCPDQGVLIAKNKQFASLSGGPNQFLLFSWVIDAHPEDRSLLDFERPNGEPVLRSIADYRQLNDALLHAGLGSGSEYEWEDEANRLHFYVIDLHEDEKGIRSYTLGVRSLDGAGPQPRGISLTAGSPVPVQSSTGSCAFAVNNEGQAMTIDPGLHSQDTNAYLTSDIYRLAVSVDGVGWKAQLHNALAAVKSGEGKSIPVLLSRAQGASPSATVTLTAQSESNPGKAASASRIVYGM
jgi:M6 family metalloprotease-like protein